MKGNQKKNEDGRNKKKKIRPGMALQAIVMYIACTEKTSQEG